MHGHVPIPTRAIGGRFCVGAAGVGSLRVLLGGQCVGPAEGERKVCIHLRMGLDLVDAIGDQRLPEKLTADGKWWTYGASGIGASGILHAVNLEWI